LDMPALVRSAETHREALDQPLTLRAQVLLHSQRLIHGRGDLLSAHTRSAWAVKRTGCARACDRARKRIVRMDILPAM